MRVPVRATIIVLCCLIGAAPSGNCLAFLTIGHVSEFHLNPSDLALGKSVFVSYSCLMFVKSITTIVT